jgi:hypothetical protein
MRETNGRGFYRPYRDGYLFLNHFPALRTGLLSLGPFLLRPSGYGGQAGTIFLPPVRLPRLLKLTRMGFSLGRAVRPGPPEHGCAVVCEGGLG